MTGKPGSWETKDNVLTFMLNSLRNTTELPLPAVDARAMHGLKFAECLPADLAASVVQSRVADTEVTFLDGR